MGANAPLCPRCGYDQSGMVAMWKDACPVAGVCSECGLEFAWRDVLNAAYGFVPGFVEHAGMPGRRIAAARRVAWAWRTLGWTLLPWRFWRRVRLHHEPRIAGMAWWVVVVLIVPFIIGALAQSIDGVLWARALGLSWRNELASWRHHLAPYISPVVALDWDAGYRLRFLRWPTCPAVALPVSLVFPILLLALSDTRRLAKVRMGHIVRGAVYGMAWLVPFTLVWAASLWEETLRAPRGRGGLAVWSGPWLRQWLHEWWQVPTALALVWVFAWWWWAIGSLLVGHGPRRVYALCALGAGIAAAAALLRRTEFALMLLE